jgi:predicted permease
MDELRRAVRSLWRTPGTTIAAVATLAVGIGPTVAMFTVVHSVLVRPLPYPEPHRVAAPVTVGDDPDDLWPLPGPIADAVDELQSFDRTARVETFLGLLLSGAEPVLVFGVRAQPGFFEIFGPRTSVGRLPAANGEAIISRRLWEQQFGGTVEIVGRPATHADRPITIVGVADATFDFPAASGIWVMDSQTPREPVASALVDVAVRLAPGRTLDAAREELNLLAASLPIERLARLDGRRLDLVSLHEAEAGFLRRPLLTLLAAAALVVLIACANVANLLLASGLARRREIAVRTAVGAAPWQVARTLLAESSLLALGGVAVGVVLAAWSLPALFAITPRPIARLADPRISGAVLAFAAGLSALVTLVFGLVPALRLSRVPGLEVLNAVTSSLSGRQSRTMGAFVGIEVALGTMLVVGATLMMTSFLKLSSGLEILAVSDVSFVTVDLPLGSPERRALASRIVDAVNGQVVDGSPGAPVATSAMPFAPVEPRDVVFPGQAEVTRLPTRSVTPGYFERLGLGILAGRGFGPGDRAGAPLVAIVNETMARRLEEAAGRPALGVAFALDVDGERAHPAAPADRPGALPEAMVQVVGIVPDVRHTMQGRPTAELYVPVSQVAPPQRLYVLGSLSDGASLTARVRRAVRDVSLDTPVRDAAGLESNLWQSLQLPRFRSVLIAMFGAVALLLAASGVFAVVAYAVARRTREVAIRMSLGASTSAVTRVITAPVLGPVVIGLFVGLASASALTTVIRSMLFYEVSPTSPSAYLTAAAVFLVAAALATWRPLGRALAVNPAEALRQE